MKALSDLDYDELLARAAQAARLPALDGDDGDYAGLDVLDVEVRSGWGEVAVTSDAWLRERANLYLRGLPDAPRPVDALRRLADDEREIVLVEALREIDLGNRHLRAFDPTKHKRWLKPHPKAGKFRPMIDLLKEAILQFDPKKDKHPFTLFSRPQLLKVARDRGIKLKKGESQDSIADKILADLGAPPAKAKQRDNLDQLSPEDLHDLAVEYGVETKGRKREEIIADLRPAIAAQKADAAKKPTKTTGLKVTTEPWPDQPMSGKKSSLIVTVDDTHVVGSVHQDADGTWTAAPVGAKKAQWTPPPKGATKEQAIQSLVDVVEADVAARKAKSAVDQAMQAGDFSGLKRVGPQAGSDPGGVFEADDGSRWYVKAQKSEAHAKNEAAASALYREAGVDVPTVHRGSGLAELGDGPQTATRIIDGAKSDLSTKLSDPGYVADVRRGFAVDAWLGNWDVVGASMDNVVTADGKPHRVDVGGSLLYRAQGAPKGDAFGKSVLEWATLRDPSRAPQASKFFADITPAQLQESAKLVENVKPARIRQLVGDPDLAQLLIDRRKDLLARTKKVKVPDFDARAAKASTGEKALEAAPIMLTTGSGRSLEGSIPVHWTDEEVEDTTNALDDYRGSDFSTINDGLRYDFVDAFVQRQVDAIDRGMSASKLESDVVVYRGIKSPRTVFGDAWTTAASAVGLTWTDKGYTSSTVDRRVADENFSDAGFDSALMRIVAPRGVSAVQLSGIAPPGAPFISMSTEAELLLQRGLTFRVVADHGYDSGKQRRILDVEVVPV